METKTRKKKGKQKEVKEESKEVEIEKEPTPKPEVATVEKDPFEDDFPLLGGRENRKKSPPKNLMDASISEPKYDTENDNEDDSEQFYIRERSSSVDSERFENAVNPYAAKPQQVAFNRILSFYPIIWWSAFKSLNWFEEIRTSWGHMWFFIQPVLPLKILE